MAARNAAIIAGSTVAGVCLAPLLAPAVLGIVGFGAAGPIAGGIAAGIQAGIGANVAAGSAFAVAQSVAMGGALPAIGYISAAAITALGGGAAVAAGA
ncbi:hypothetical protein QCA50_011638 [Cerrena zonata]|uniref:Uncharacterized protein n=1 Tax=Cerrena zonata TaxID=2478898 RepID=A0AAW0FVP1_9APHY